MIKDLINQDLKQALLARDAATALVLRGLKGSILNAEIAAGNRDTGLSDDAVIALLQKEAKKRQESADLYKQGGDDERAQVELTEKAMIEKYLPAQMSEDDIRALIQAEVAKLEDRSPRAMGQVITAIKTQTKGAADGSIIAQIVKEEL